MKSTQKQKTLCCKVVSTYANGIQMIQPVLNAINDTEKKDNASTTAQVKQTIAEDDQTYSQYAIGVPNNNDRSKTKILGVNWDNETDKLLFDLSSIVGFANALPPTKRSVLKIAAKIFDPFGHLSVFTINIKTIFQQLCIQKLGWDEELQGSHRNRFMVFVSDIKSLHGISVSRYLFRKDSSAKAVEIHGFADSSEQAYAGVVYLRVEYESGEVEVKMIASKSKVCPIQRQSIQRLELLDAFLLAKLVHSVREILKDELGDMIVKTYYGVDSYSALCWIRNVKHWTPYVRHRVSQILQTSDRDEWHHCPGQINPADLPSRGKYRNLAASSLWWEGPAFLKLEAREWPKLSCGSEFEVDVAMKEQLKTQCRVTHSIFTAENRSQPRVDKIVELDRFSNKGKLLRTVAWVLRFTSNLKAAIKKDDINREEMVTVSEINQAELVLVQSIQAESFS